MENFASEQEKKRIFRTLLIYEKDNNKTILPCTLNAHFSMNYKLATREIQERKKRRNLFSLTSNAVNLNTDPVRLDRSFSIQLE